MMNRIGQILLALILTELCLGGGGRFTAIGPVSLRMILFALALLFTGASFLSGRKIKKEYFQFLLVFVLVLTIGLLVGIINHASANYWWEDVKPLLYFFMLPFFALTIQQEEDIRKSAFIIRWSSLIIAGVFFLTLILIHSHLIPFLTFYNSTLKSGELFYRGEYTFFYKGFLFLGIGVIFFAFSNHRFKYIFIILLVMALLLSFTRGLLLALSLTLFSFAISPRKITQSIIFILISFFILIYGGSSISALSRWMTSQNLTVGNSPPERAAALLGDRSYSDDQRKLQLQEVYSQASLSSLLVGHGLGMGVPSKPIHMEIAYLEIVHKQGLIGLLFWGILAWKIFQSYRSAPPSFLSHAFFFSSVFVAIESLTNQYINNPIGMSVLMVSWVCLNQLKGDE